MSYRGNPYGAAPPPRPQQQQGPLQPLQDPTRDLVPMLAKVNSKTDSACLQVMCHTWTLNPTTMLTHKKGTLNLAKKHYVVSSLWIAGLILLAFFQGTVVPQDRLNQYDRVMRGIDHKQ